MQKYVVKRDEVKIGTLTNLVIPKINIFQIEGHGTVGIEKVDAQENLKSIGIKLVSRIMYPAIIYKFDKIDGYGPVKVERSDRLDVIKTLGITVKDGEMYRGMIYRVDNNNHAQDLIYTTPTNHVIDGIEPSIVLNEEPMLLMRNAELGELLKYLKFGEDLTQDDLNKIYRMFLKHRIWLRTHPELFGFFKKDGIIYHDESKAIFPEELFYSLYNASYVGGNPNKNEAGFESIRRIR